MKNAIEVANLTKCYGKLIAVDNVSFSVERGTVFGLLGANGAGKSTTIECILGTQRKNFGEIQVLGMDPIKDRKKLYQKVAVQFQDCAFQSLIRVDELCQSMQCLYSNPVSYKFLLEKFNLLSKAKAKVSTLSGGERQRLFIVLALIPKPEVVFLDELTTGLDTLSRKEVWQYLLELKNSGLTIVLTSHYMDEVEQLCDQIAMLNGGRIVYKGTVQEAATIAAKLNFEEAYECFIKEKN